MKKRKKGGRKPTTVVKRPKTNEKDSIPGGLTHIPEKQYSRVEQFVDPPMIVASEKLPRDVVLPVSAQPVNTQEKKYKGIAILGSHPQTVMMSPFDDEDWLIYACSPHNFEMRTLPRFDQWFETHIPIQDATRGYNYLKYLETLPHVWMRDKDQMSHFKGAKPYPEEEMKEKFCPYMFTSSIALMLASAIVDCEEKKIPAIGIFGVMQASPGEYTYQRPGIQYFIWEAERRGLDVIVPDISRLFEPPEENW
jgi:hypothetical protein